VTGVRFRIYPTLTLPLQRGGNIPLLCKEGPGEVDQVIHTSYQLPVTSYQLPVTSYQSPFTSHQSQIGCHMSIITLLSAVIPIVPATPGNAVDFTWLFLKMLLILGIVCIFAVLLLKYAMPQIGFLRHINQGKFFTVRARQAIEPRKTLYIIELGKRYHVIGVTDHGISLITELSRSEFEEMNTPPL